MIPSVCSLVKKKKKYWTVIRKNTKIKSPNDLTFSVLIWKIKGKNLLHKAIMIIKNEKLYKLMV